MKKRWRLVLCGWGLILFGLITYASIRERQDLGPALQHSRYFWWGTLRLDSDPLSIRTVLWPCQYESDEDCSRDLGTRWGTPGWVEKGLVLSALPAFLLTALVVRSMAFFGVNEVLSFMCAAPLLILLWFYAIGWVIDRWQYKRFLHRTSKRFLVGLS